MIYVVIIVSFLVYSYILAERAFMFGYELAQKDMLKILEEIEKRNKFKDED